MRILSVVGDGRDVLRLAPLARALAGRPDVEHVVVHTGTLGVTAGARSLFRELDLPAPAHHLGVAPGTHAAEIGAAMLALEPILRELRPEVTLVYGDGNAAVAAALVAAGLGVSVGHVEAGLRCGDWSRPDELNRATVDRVSALLFAPSRDAVEQLALEGAAEERVHFVGSTLIDTLSWTLPRARANEVARGLGVCAGAYAVAAIDQPATVDDPEILGEVVAALQRVAASTPVLWCVEPHTRQRVEALDMRRVPDGCLVLLEPLPYVDLAALIAGAGVVVTDANDLQEETTFLGVPCVTVGSSTARAMTCLVGTNRLVQPRCDTLVAAVQRAIARRSPARPVVERWDGRAAERIVAVVCEGARVDDPASRPARHSVATAEPLGAA